MVKISVSSRYGIDKKSLAEHAQKRLKRAGAGSFLVNIIIVGKRKMKSIEKACNQDAIAHPVLSFTFNETSAPTGETPLLGEIFICHPQAVALAAERSRSVNKTLRQLINHGIDNLLKEQ
jgi:ssRNA-specific RNase YbeY (16S rRNA maturation enzyme)